VGWPVAHSLSPTIQNAALRATGLDRNWRYQLLPVPPELFDATTTALPAAGFRGVNVTIPHKRAALELALARERAGDATLTPRARAIGAVNALVFEPGGRLLADNTDGPGLVASLRRRLDPRGASALVLGSGGSARAALWGLRDAGVTQLAVWNRTPARARELARELDATVASDTRLAGEVDILVNCTALGLHGESQLEPLGLDPGDLRGLRVVVDFVYRAAAATELCAAARAQGVAAIDGLELLVEQGAISFELFTATPPPLEAMRAAVGLCSAA